MAGFSRFSYNRDGNVSVAFALSLVAVLGISGAAYDFSKAFEARTMLQSTVDGAALAAGADDTNDKVKMDELAQNYLNGNPPPSDVVTLGVLTTDYDAATKTVSAKLTGEAPTTFLGLVGYDSIPITATTEAKRSEPGPLELVLALDVTNSMNEYAGTERKITTLKTAAVKLVNTVMASPYAKVGIVPFGGAMNIGTSYKNKSWVYPRPDYETSSCTSTLVSPGSGYSCSTKTYSCVQDGVSKTCTSTSCYYAVPPVYTHTCKKVTNSWNGCIGPRRNYESTIDSPTNPKYPWTASSCGSMLMDLSSSKTTVVTKINGFGAGLDTYIPIGLVWAWNMLTPEEPLTSAASKDTMADLGGKKVIVLMTDGLNSLYPSYYTSGDYEGGATLNTISNQAKQAEVDNSLRELCSNVKKDGVVLYTIAFAVTDSNIKSILNNCASDKTKYFDASDGILLEDAFTKIGESLKRLRIAK